MTSRGIPVGLGTDGCASNNNLDMFREMDMLAKIQKIACQDATVLPAQTALHFATVGNANLLNLSKTGKLEIGWQADLIVLNLNQPHLTPFYNPDLIVYAASGADVETVMINGRLVMEKRLLLSFDLEETKTRVNELACKARIRH